MIALHIAILISDLLLTVFAARGLWFLHKRWKTPAGDQQNLYFQRIKFSIYAASTFLVISGALRLVVAHYGAL